MSLEEGNFGSLSSDDEDVVKSGGEFESIFIFNVDDFVRSGMLFQSDDRSNSSDVISSSDHDFSSDFEFEVGGDFVGSQVELDGVVNFDKGVGESDGSSVMSDDIRDSFRSHSSSFNSAKFEFGFA